MKFYSSNKFRTYLTISVYVFFIFLVVCGDDNNPTGPEEPSADLTGTWVVQQIINGNCEGDNYPIEITDIATIIQSENDLTITFSASGALFEGKISANNVTWSGSTSEDDGILSIEFSGSVSNDGTTVTGTATWTWTNDMYTCSGTTVVNAIKSTSTFVDVTGTWEGSWQSSVYTTMSGTFATNITQQDTLLFGTISVPEIHISEANLKGTIFGNFITFGDIEEKITFTGILMNDSTSSGTYVYSIHNDNGSWQAVKADTGSISYVLWKKEDIGFTLSNKIN